MENKDKKDIIVNIEANKQQQEVKKKNLEHFSQKTIEQLANVSEDVVKRLLENSQQANLSNSSLQNLHPESIEKIKNEIGKDLPHKFFTYTSSVGGIGAIIAVIIIYGPTILNTFMGLYGLLNHNGTTS